jgi:hypothetical protein
MNTPKSPKQQKEEAKIAYDKYVKKHKKNLFKAEMIPMTDEDIALVQKRANFTRSITARVFYVVAGIATLGGIYLLYIGDWALSLVVFLCAMVLVLFLRSLTATYRKLLEQKEKLVVTGIVTSKEKQKRENETLYYLTLSEKKDVVVRKKDYDQYRLGDIVRYETLSEERYISHAITLTGKIGDDADDKK